MSDSKLGYWAVLEHAITWRDDAKVLDDVRQNDGKLTEKIAALIAGRYKVARTFHGVKERGYGRIAEVVNAVDVDSALTLSQRVQGAADAVDAIEQHGYRRNPSGVTKLLWFRNPNHWYMYDTQAASAVGAGRSTVQGMRGFFGILSACDADTLNLSIASLIAQAGFDLRSERVIDKFLWLRGAVRIDDNIAKLNARESRLFTDRPTLRDLAMAIHEILPDDRFDLLRQVDSETRATDQTIAHNI